MSRIALSSRIDLDINTIRSDFPILKRTKDGKPLAYLDNAATTQKPTQVIQAIQNYYTYSNANIKRAIHFLDEEATQLYEEARAAVAEFVGARKPCEIIFTRNTTEGINLVAYSYARTHLKPGDEILLTKMEHHSNLVPWRIIADECGFKIKYIDVDPEGRLMLDDLDKILTEKIKLVAVTYVSNTLGTINPVHYIIKKAHLVGAKVLIDAAQAVAHMPLCVDTTKRHSRLRRMMRNQEDDIAAKKNDEPLKCDFLVFSGHKMFGPTGIGVVYIKEEIADLMPPLLGGGEMIKEVFLDHYVPGDTPEKFEAGTPHIAGAICLKTAIDYIEQLGFEKITQAESILSQYTLKQLSMLSYLNIIGPKTTENRIGNFSFTVDGIHPHDLSDLLNEEAICTRSGHHCTQPLMEHFGILATTRASLAFYNTSEEIDRLVRAIEKAYAVFH